MNNRYTRKKKVLVFLGIFLLLPLVVLLLVPPHAIATPSLQTIEHSIFDNIKQYGFDADPRINNGLGGLWVNWRSGTSPLQTNFNGSGQPDGEGITPPRHDPLTDIRYVHNLWLYKAQNPSDSRYDTELQKYTAIVKAEYAQAADTQRGWLYDEEFADLYALSHDMFYQQQMQNLAASYAKSINPAVGIYFKTNKNHPQGYYRPEDALETGLALVQAGTQFNNSTWTQLGQNEVTFVYQHAYIPQYHTFADEMDQVLTLSGTSNPNETFYHDTFRNDTVYGNQSQVAALGQIVISLLHTYQLTHTDDYRSKAFDLLTPLTATRNSLGLWDPVNGGYFENVSFSGTSPQEAGSSTVANAKKDPGRQMEMLLAFHLANQVGGSFTDMEQQMRTIGLTKVYYAPGQGVVFEMRPDWSLVTVKGSPEDWVTTEAMGITLEGLLSEGNTMANTSQTLDSSHPTTSSELLATPPTVPHSFLAFFLAWIRHLWKQCLSFLPQK